MITENEIRRVREKYYRVIRKYYSNVDEIVLLINGGWEGCPKEILDANKECEREMMRLVQEHHKQKNINYFYGY